MQYNTYSVIWKLHDVSVLCHRHFRFVWLRCLRSWECQTCVLYEDTEITLVDSVFASGNLICYLKFAITVMGGKMHNVLVFLKI